ncbi:MAG: O-succinylhomoserine sulfhydrylase [Rhizobiales bacterium]|nr:O-succinylhomoserine sulfhydrylase [Hyphomicrobiales bacterium]
MTNKAKPDWKPATQAVHGGITRSQFGETSEALYLTQGFVYDNAEAAEARFNGEDDGFIYSRYANPTVDMFEKRMCLLEGAQDARATASGMAAVTSSLACQVKAGDHIVAAKALFGSNRWVIENMLGNFGVEYTLVDGRNIEAWKNAVQPNTKVFFLETPTNPTLELVDIQAVADIAHECNAKLIVDNVFATPVLQKPMELGADIVVYSATKHIDGQGRCLGGVILSDQEWVDENLHDFFRHTGPGLSPFNAWVLLKGLETLALRVKQQSENASHVATFLSSHKLVERSMYPGHDTHPQFDLAEKQMPGGSTLVAFELKGGKKAAFAFENALDLIKLSNNLGDAKSLVTHPATTTHKSLSEEDRAELGINDGLVRLSLGLEDKEDLLSDIEQALDVVAKA